MICVYIHSKFCPKCECFKFGYVIRNNGIVTDDKPEKSSYDIIRTVCELVGIPLTEVDASDEIDIHIPPIINRGILQTPTIPSNTHKYWLGRVLNRQTIELPGFLILSDLTKTRYISVEIITESRTPDALIITKWSAVRQVLRGIARTYIEERLILAGKKPTPDYVDYLLSRLFPIDEEGEPNIWRWVESFIKVKHMRIRR